MFLKCAVTHFPEIFSQIIAKWHSFSMRVAGIMREVKLISDLLVSAIETKLNVTQLNKPGYQEQHHRKVHRF